MLHYLGFDLLFALSLEHHLAGEPARLCIRNMPSPMKIASIESIASTETKSDTLTITVTRLTMGFEHGSYALKGSGHRSDFTLGSWGGLDGGGVVSKFVQPFLQDDPSRLSVRE